MDVIILFNGLGNQMSQYAFYLKKKSIHKRTFLVNFCNQHNGYELDKVFNISYVNSFVQKILTFLFKVLFTKKIQIILKPVKLLLHLLGCRVINENFDYNFNKDFLISSPGINFFLGGWHSQKYFISEKASILDAFNFRIPCDHGNVDYINRIKSSNSVSIHIRRGDYLDSENIDLFGDVCTKQYFLKAIDLVRSKVAQPLFFVFSNDIPWVMANFPETDITPVTCNKDNNSWIDLYLMSICDHNIISNSSFSWWGAWLNRNPDKIVITPDRFLKTVSDTDVYPVSWIKLSDY